MDHLQVAVFLSMAGAFTLGLMLGVSYKAALAFGAGVHHGRTEALEICRKELEAI